MWEARMKRGQSLWEFVLLLAVLAGIFVWIDFKKQTETNNIEDGAKQTNVTNKKFALINDVSFLNWHSAPKITNASIPTTPLIPVVVTPVEPTLAETLGIPKENMDRIGHFSTLEKVGLDLVVILVVMVVGGLLDALGGDGLLFCRRFIMPVLLSAGISILAYSIYQVWYAWFTGLMVIPMCGTLTLGYSNEGNFGRGLWLFLQAVVAGIFLVITSYFFHAHFLAWYLYVWYVVTSGIWGGMYKNWYQFFGDWITGSWLCSLVFYVFLSLMFKL